MNFELKLNKMGDMPIETIKMVLQYFEQVLKLINIDIEGSTKELFDDEEFIYYIKLMSCEINFNPSV